MGQCPLDTMLFSLNLVLELLLLPSMPNPDEFQAIVDIEGRATVGSPREMELHKLSRELHLVRCMSHSILSTLTW